MVIHYLLIFPNMQFWYFCLKDFIVCIDYWLWTSIALWWNGNWGLINNISHDALCVLITFVLSASVVNTIAFSGCEYGEIFFALNLDKYLTFRNVTWRIIKIITLSKVLEVFSWRGIQAGKDVNNKIISK